jgi:hypothetical protein
MKRKLLLALCSLATVSVALAAEDTAPMDQKPASGTAAPVAEQASAASKPMHVVLGGGVTGGGDTLYTAVYTDGSTDKVTAGGALQLYAGLDYRLSDAYSVQATLGLHLDTTKAASNGSVTFSRMPLEALGYYHVNNAFRVGAGLRLVTGAKLKGTGVGSAVDSSYDSTIGVIIEGEYMFDKTVGIKLRHVNESYRDKASTTRYQGNHWGLLANVYF